MIERVLPSVVMVIALAATACGGGGASAPTVALSPAAEAGRSIAVDSGCTSCHGANGQGGVGPAWVGLAGSVRPLVDGTEVVADRAYLTRSIVEPQAQQAQGYTIMMPVSNLSDAQVASIVDYLEELS